MITSYHGGNTSFSNFPFRAPFRTPRCLGWEGELAKEVNFVFMFCYYFVQAHFVMFSGLLGPLSIKLLYFTVYFFKIWTHFVIKLFVVLPNLWFEKLKLCPIILMLDWFHA